MPDWTPPIPLPDLATVTVDVEPDDPEGRDVLVVGYTDHAVELAATDRGRKAVTWCWRRAAWIPTASLPAADNALRRMERERRITDPLPVDSRRHR